MSSTARQVAVHIPVVEAALLEGELIPPREDRVGGDRPGATPSARTVVVFAHGSGSSRHSPRNQAVARVLQDAGLGTLLLDLLTEREEPVDEVTGEYRFDIDLLGRRVVAAIDWLDGRTETAGLRLGLFGASTGAAAALVAAAQRPDRITAVVARGGRPDLAEDALERVRAPVLLIVGGLDTQVLRLNTHAARRLRAPHRLDVIPGATHLFAEHNAIEQVAIKARDWFLEHSP
jgi:putative phosphoribosyl transferase